MQSAIDGGEENIDFDIEDIKDTLPVTWEDFNCAFNDEVPKYEEIRQILEDNFDKKVDMRPYMEPSPHYVNPKDSLQKLVDIFRMHHIRYLPVVENEQVVGIITR